MRTRRSLTPPHPAARPRMRTRARIACARVRASAAICGRILPHRCCQTAPQCRAPLCRRGRARRRKAKAVPRHAQAGGYRVAAFVSGGVVPAALRGTSVSHFTRKPM